MSGFAYTSVLPSSRYEELANLMFFNRQQHRVRDDIVNAIDLYGVPEIVAAERSLRFCVAKLGEVQAIYALEGDSAKGRLVGTLLYARVSDDKIVLLHMSVAAAYASGGPAAGKLLALKMIERLKRACKTLKGVRELEILYGRRAAAIRIEGRPNCAARHNAPHDPGA
jgi:hypothetical protein